MLSIVNLCTASRWACIREDIRVAASVAESGALFPQRKEQHDDLKKLKKAFVCNKVLRIADERAAIIAANNWLSGNLPIKEGRPFEVRADTSKIAWGGVLGQE